MKEISIDCNKKGLMFMGIGGVTSNGMTKLLYEYDDDIRNEILDFLFKPKFGASLHMLKVEIGSDANGTCGTEPSHMRSEDDFDITRGFGLTMARDAKSRNAKMIFDAIRWGTPAWICNREEKYKFYLNFLKGANEVYGVDFDYLAPDENEGDYDIDFVVNVLRPGLDRDGFEKIKLSAADSTEDWNIVPIVKGNPDLLNSISVISRHYKEDSPADAKTFGIPIFDSEDQAPFRHKFSCALDVAYKIIRSYASGRMVQYVMHPIIEAIYDNLPYTCKSILTASTPWNGNYEINPGLWIIAHFTQFAEPGWFYIDDGCLFSSSISILSFINPASDDLSFVILNRSEADIDLNLRIDNADSSLFHVFYSDENEQFSKLPDVKLKDNRVLLKMHRLSIMTLTTTSGQEKGIPIYKKKADYFNLPYSDDFSSYKIGKQPRLTVDQAGAFEIHREGKSGANALVQVLGPEEKPIDWERRPTPRPYTILGSEELSNYSLDLDFRMDSDNHYDFPQYVMAGIRCNFSPAKGDIPFCYNIRIYENGRWFLSLGPYILESGIINNFTGTEWHSIKLSAIYDEITAMVDGALLCKIHDDEISSGNIVLGSDYSRVRFDSILISDIGAQSSINRYIVSDNRIRKSGSWHESGANSDNFFRTLFVSDQKNDEITFDFSGNYLSIIGNKDNNAGFADVYIDDLFIKKIDIYSDSRAVRRSIFSIHGLKGEFHRCRVVVSGERRDDSSSSYVYINAIETEGELLSVL